MKVETRTLVRESDGVRTFLEVSWSGHEVEIVVGRVGTAGVGETQTFETVEQRDAWIAKRIATAVRQGYVEGGSGDVPVPEPVDDAADEDVAEAARLREKVGVTAFLPIYAVDDAPNASKLGGTPWLDGPWPVCPTCTKPLRFVLQLRRDDVPESCRWAFRADLIQLFLCDAAGKPGAPRWLCQADGHGWEPFAPSTLVRHAAIVGEPISVSAAMSRELRVSVARFEHMALDAYVQAGGDPPLPEPTPSTLAARAEQLIEVPHAADAFHRGQLWIYPPQRITGWEQRLDVPAYGDLDLDQQDLLETKLGLTCCHVDKLAGPPAWIQDPYVPRCRGCRADMRSLFQVVSRGPIQIGGDGTGWLFICPTCREGTFTWQR